MNRQTLALVATLIITQLFTVGCSNSKTDIDTSKITHDSEGTLNGNNDKVISNTDEISLSEAQSKKDNMPKTSKELLKEKQQKENKDKTKNIVKKATTSKPSSTKNKATTKGSTSSQKPSAETTNNDRAVSNDIIPSHESNISNHRGVELEGDVSTKDADYLLTLYNRLPNNLRQKFTNDGYKIRITSEDIAKKYYGDSKYGQILAFYSKADKKLYVINNQQKIYKTFLHEFGHYLDDLNGYISETIGFVSLFNKEKNYLKTDYPTNTFKSNSTNYFSEVFQQMYLNPERTQRSCPNSVAFISKLIQKAK